MQRILFSTLTLLLVALNAKESSLGNNTLMMSQERFEREVFAGHSIDDEKLSLPEDADYIWFIYFSAPWCAHCRRLQPVWDQVVTRLANGKISEFMGVKLAQVDC